MAAAGRPAPAAYEPRLVTSLSRLAQAMNAANQTEEALDVAAEAVTLGPADRPKPGLGNLGIAMAVLSETLSALGRHRRPSPPATRRCGSSGRRTCESGRVPAGTRQRAVVQEHRSGRARTAGGGHSLRA